LAKIDKSQYTKEEWRILKEQRRLEKEQRISAPILDTVEPRPLLPPVEGTNKNYLLCLKHGTKYSADYVNKLYNMVQRNCTVPYEFVCLTDDTKGLNPLIKTIPLPSNLQGWWCKPYMFNKNLPLQGTVLYMDLDVVIAGNIDKLFTYQPDKWCTIRDFTRAMRPSWNKYNSSIVRFKTGQLHHVWEGFEANQRDIQRRLFGDQDWLYEATRKTQAMLYPDSWILSWKWEVRKSKEFDFRGTKGNRKFKHVEDVKPRVECCVTVFHGDPNPHNCDDPWVVDNWR
jgi:hypothetical protein